MLILSGGKIMKKNDLLYIFISTFIYLSIYLWIYEFKRKINKNWIFILKIVKLINILNIQTKNKQLH